MIQTTYEKALELNLLDKVRLLNEGEPAVF